MERRMRATATALAATAALSGALVIGAGAPASAASIASGGYDGYDGHSGGYDDGGYDYYDHYYGYGHGYGCLLGLLCIGYH